MSTWHGIGKRGGPDELWRITWYGYKERESSWYRSLRGHFFDGLHYPHKWDISYELVWRRHWRSWHLGWSFETIGYNEEHYGLSFYLLPFAAHLHLTTNGILPKPTKEREWQMVGMLSEGVSHSPCVHYNLGPGGINHPWKDKQGRKVTGIFDLWDFLFGRNQYSKVTGEPYELDVPLPERTYKVIATPDVSTWKRPRWPWWPLKLVRSYVDINANADPLPDPGNSESDFYDGEDATFGMSVNYKEGESKRVIGQRVADRVMDERKRRGAGYDWRPTRDWRKPPKTDGDVAVEEKRG